MLLIGLVLVGFLIWQAWQEDYGPKPAMETAGAPAGVPAGSVDVPAVPTPATTGTAETGSGGVDVPSAPNQGTAPVAAEASSAAVVVETDLMRVEIDPVGGTLRRLRLNDFAQSTEQPDEPFTLLTTQPPDVFLIQSGLVGNEAAPSHRAAMTPEKMSYLLADGVDELSVPLVWRSADGVEITKRFVFTRGLYAVRVESEIKNNSEKPWPVRMYGQLLRAEVEPEGGLFRTYTYTGGVVSQPEKPYQKYDFDDMASQDLAATYRGGWAAMIQHYFVAAVVPPENGDNYYYTKSLGNARFVLGVMGPTANVAPGSSETVVLNVYAGPKDQDRLQAIAPYLERTVDYGWLWFIAEPLFYALRWIHGYVGNWGFAIILLTICIKLLFFHLSAASYKSMARMRKLQPRIVQRCLPILVQIPVFISLYWVLLESVELRQSPFILWLTDLSEHDPYFVLPLLMGASMFVQQRLNPAPPDPVQAKIMMMLPIVFTFLFLFFPSGLVLYWFVNNLLSIAQQWVITRKIVGPDG
jgi:YidC/Oxa1 family membrane protein insertase